jgi:hypothetical protein
LYLSAACYLEGRKYINEAITSGKTELGRVSEAIEKIKEASKNYKKAHVCYNVYSGLLKILEYVEGERKVEVSDLENFVAEAVKPFQDDVSLEEIKASFESIPKIFQEDSRTTRRQRQEKFEERISLTSGVRGFAFIPHLSLRSEEGDFSLCLRTPEVKWFILQYS